MFCSAYPNKLKQIKTVNLEEEKSIKTLISGADLTNSVWVESRVEKEK